MSLDWFVYLQMACQHRQLTSSAILCEFALLSSFLLLEIRRIFIYVSWEQISNSLIDLYFNIVCSVLVSNTFMSYHDSALVVKSAMANGLKH